MSNEPKTEREAALTEALTMAKHIIDHLCRGKVCHEIDNTRHLIARILFTDEGGKYAKPEVMIDCSHPYRVRITSLEDARPFHVFWEGSGSNRDQCEKRAREWAHILGLAVMVVKLTPDEVDPDLARKEMLGTV